LKRLAFLMVAFVALAVPLVARAQDATPVASPEATPVATSLVPAPEECTVEPISVERLSRLMAAPDASPITETEASPFASPAPFVMPEGQEADAATTAAITAAVREYVACVNAGDYARVMALMSDRLIRELFAVPLASGATPQEILDQLGSAQPLPENQRTLIYGVDDVRVLPDGRVAALVVGDDLSKPGPPGPALFYFVQLDGRWLVDGFVPTEEIVGSTP